MDPAEQGGPGRDGAWRIAKDPQDWCKYFELFSYVFEKISKKEDCDVDVV